MFMISVLFNLCCCISNKANPLLEPSNKGSGLMFDEYLDGIDAREYARDKARRFYDYIDRYSRRIPYLRRP
ncbi:hypothetical protein ECANGB1_161 [Enterospora canceri]|uniref:Uncharacterized protein n=1 Tax=Enterospora canceri TaxID=1081671 RepID=A0A1Y1S4M3_9MICR|nr:hypothetical protein ECANGB1_161 [Enterospora canceri]